MDDVNFAPLLYFYYLMDFLQKNMAIVLLFIAAILILVLIATYNALVRARFRVGEAWSGIDVQLRRRASLIPNLVETVKGYAGHEAHVFEDVTRHRSNLLQAKGASEAAKADQGLTQALGRLLAVAENYPQLRASENFMQLQNELSDVEQKIAYARQFYNGNARDYNTRIQSFPTLILANLFKFQMVEFFRTDEQGRGELKVDFSALK
jgi:LemA protein